MKTTVVHCQSEEYDVYIGRAVPRHKLKASKWANPYYLYDDTLLSRIKCLAGFLQFMVANPHLVTDLHELKGKRLGCWCAPKLCHGHILAVLADALEEK